MCGLGLGFPGCVQGIQLASPLPVHCDNVTNAVQWIGMMVAVVERTTLVLRANSRQVFVALCPATVTRDSYLCKLALALVL